MMRRSRFRSAIVSTVLSVGTGVVVFAWHRHTSQVPLERSDLHVNPRMAESFEPAAARRVKQGETESSGAGEAALRGAPETGSSGSAATARGDIGELQPSSRTAGAPNDRTGEGWLQAEALRHPSDSYRDTTLITLIRDAGHICTDVVWSAAGTHDGSTWRVSCDGARSFIVAEDRAGGFVVEPLPYIEMPFMGLPKLEDESNASSP